MLRLAAALMLAVSLTLAAAPLSCAHITAEELDALETAHAEADARLAAVEQSLALLRENEARRAALLERAVGALRISAEALDRAIRRLGGGY